MNDATKKANEILGDHADGIIATAENGLDTTQPIDNGEQTPEEFDIDTDIKFDFVVERIKNAQIELARLDDLRKEKIAVTNKAFEDLAEPIRKMIAFFSRGLIERVKSMDIKPTQAGTLKYKVLAGVVYVKKQAPKIERDDDAFKDFLFENELTNFIKVKTTESIDWSSFKGEIVIDGESAFYGGQELDFLKVIQRDDKLEIK